MELDLSVVELKQFCLEQSVKVDHPLDDVSFMVFFSMPFLQELERKAKVMSKRRSELILAREMDKAQQQKAEVSVAYSL